MTARERMAHAIDQIADGIRGGKRPPNPTHLRKMISYSDSGVTNPFPFSGDAAIITKGRPKMALVEKLHLVAINDPDLTSAVDAAEQSFDQENEIGIVTFMPEYPKMVTLAKLQALRKVVNEKFVATDRDLVITDFTWKVGGSYLNKPRSEEDISKMENIYSRAADAELPIVGEGWIARYNMSQDNFYLYRFETEFGQFVGDLFRNGKKRDNFHRMMLGEINKASGGLDFTAMLINNHLDMHSKSGRNKNGIELSVERYSGNFSEGRPIVEPEAADTKSMFSASVLQGAVAGMLPFIDAFKVGIVPKEFEFNLNDYLYLDGREFEKTSSITSTDSLQKKIEEWRRSVLFPAELDGTVTRLKSEADEVRLVFQQMVSGHRDRLDVASHSADVFIYACQILNRLGVRVTESLFSGQTGVTFEQYEDRLSAINSPKREKILSELQRKINALEKHKTYTGNQEIIMNITMDIANLSALIIMDAGYHLQPILVGKHDRNIRKYPHDLFTRQNLQILSKITRDQANTIIKNLWDSQFDRDILSAHVKDYEDKQAAV